MSSYYMNLLNEWERIKSQIRFDRILAHYQMPMKKKSNLALCPFHNDHNPSMHINEIGGLYHCFSCGASGDIINFIRQKEQCNFIAAVRLACDICAIPLLLNLSLEHNFAHQDLYDINKNIAEYFHLRLLENSQMLEILKNRNITTDHIIRHQLGFATNLAKLTKTFIDIATLRKIGLLNTQNKFLFANRIIFPIMLITGQIVGFGGRTTYKNPIMKYLNSQESEIFEKKKLVYNMQHLATLPDKPIYIVEGYFDAIKLQELNYRAVALMGTSMSKDVFNMLCQYSNYLILALDQDTSGRQALNNILEKIILPNLKPQHNIHIAIYRYKDPAEAVDENQFKHITISVATYYQYCCGQNYPESSKALRNFYQISLLINNSEARNNFYAQWKANAADREKTAIIIQSFQTNIYLQNDLKKQKYLQYAQCLQYFPNILINLKLDYPHLLIINELNKLHHKAITISNAQDLSISQQTAEMMNYKYYYDLIIDLAIDNALETLKGKSKTELTKEQALEIFNTTMEINKLRNF